MSINMALDIAMRSLRTHSAAINVTNHNVANMNDPFYSRQLANITATAPLTNIGAAGQMGTGSVVSAIERIRDRFLDSQIQNEMSNVGKWSELYRTFQILSAVMPEVNGSTSGLQAKLDKFFADWQTLSDVALTGVTADIDAARAVLYSDATAFAKSMNNMSGALKDLRLGLTTDMKSTVDIINTYSQQIYAFNKEIRYAVGIGQRPNDMLDKRNEAITKLSEYVNIETMAKTDGTVVVHINGHALVNGGDGYNEMTTIPGRSDTRLEDIGLSENGRVVDITKNVTAGKLGGMLESRDEVIKPYKDQLDNLASSLINAVNKIHRAGGSAPTDFFLGFKADTIMVNPALEDPTRINYSLYTANDLAEAIANLDNKVLNNYITSSTLNIPMTATPAAPTTQIRSLLQPPIGADYNGVLLINSVPVQYNTADTLETLMNKINNNVSNFSIVFNPHNSQFFMVGNDLFTVQEQTAAANPSLLGALGWIQETVSAAPINSAPSPTINTIRLNQSWDANITTAPYYVAKYIFNTPADMGTYPNGIFTVNYNNIAYDITWNAANMVALTMSQVQPITGGVTATPDTALQKYRFYSRVGASVTPGVRAELLSFSFGDKQGNLTEVLNLPGTTRFGSVYKTMVGKVTGQLASGESLLNGYKAALQQYENMQTEITSVDLEQELANAKMYQRAYDASVKLLSIIDQMMNMLINGTGSPSSSWRD